MLAPAVSFFTGDNSKKVKYKSGKDSLKVDIVTVGVMTVINAYLLGLLIRLITILTLISPLLPGSITSPTDLAH